MPSKRKAKKPTRDSLITEFACQLGGYNASRGVHPGRLADEFGDSINDDVVVVRRLISIIKEEARNELMKKIAGNVIKLIDS